MHKHLNLIAYVALVLFIAGCVAGCVSGCASKSTASVDKKEVKEEAAVKADDKKEEVKAEVKEEATTAANEEMTSTEPSTLSVEDAVIATSVANLTPSGTGTEFTKDTERIYCFSKIIGGGTDSSVKHVWYHNDKLSAEIELPVKASTWRTYSYKTIVPEFEGKWKVEITDNDGKVLKTLDFEIK